MANILPESTAFVRDLYDEVLAQAPVTTILEKPAGEFEAIAENGYVRLLTVIVDGMSDYYSANAGGTSSNGAYAYRDKGGYYSGFKRGSAASSWEVYKLKHKRGIQIPIDAVQSVDQMNMTLAKVAGEFYRTQLARELDISRLSTIAAATNKFLGNRVEKAGYTAGTDKVLPDFDAAFQWIREVGGNDADAVLFISNKVNTALKQDPSLSRFIIVGEYTDARNVTTTVKLYDGHPIVVVPENLFYTDPIYGDNGLSPDSTSLSINFIACDPKYVHPITKLEFAHVYGEEVVTDFHGWLFDFLIYYDTIIPTQKAPAIFASVNTSANAGVVNSRLLKLSLVAGAASGYTHINGWYTLPSGLNGKLVQVCASTAPALGGTFTAAAPSAGVTGGAAALAQDAYGNYQDFAPLTPETGEKLYFCLIDENSKFIALFGEATSVPVGS